MSKEIYKRIFDEAYRDYCDASKTEIIKKPNGETHVSQPSHYNFKSKDEFIVKVRADEEFAKQWGLIFESRDLTREELCEMEPKLNGIYDRKLEVIKSQKYEEAAKIRYEEKSILETLPSRVITLTYKNENIEVYE